MKIALLVVIVSCGIAALLFLPKRQAPIHVSDFEWTIQGKTAQISFHIGNRTEESLVVTVFVAADDKTEGMDGTTVTPSGRGQVEVALSAREEKKVEAEIQLFYAGGSTTALSYHWALKLPNQTPQRNAGGRPFSSDSPASETPSSLGPRG